MGKKQDITKAEFLKDAEEAWNKAFSDGNVTNYAFILVSEGGFNYHSGYMSCEQILTWAMRHYIDKEVKLAIKEDKGDLEEEFL